MPKLISAESIRRKYREQICSIIYTEQTALCHSYLPPVTPLPDGGKRKRKYRSVFLEKYEGPVIPEYEKFTPLPIQEPMDHFDFSDPTNDLIKQMQR